MATSTLSGVASTPYRMGALHTQDDGLRGGRVLYFDDFCGGLMTLGVGLGSKQFSGSKSEVDLIGDDGTRVFEHELGWGLWSGRRSIRLSSVGGYSPSMMANSVGELSSMKRTSCDVINDCFSMSSRRSPFVSCSHQPNSRHLMDITSSFPQWSFLGILTYVVDPKTHRWDTSGLRPV
jgi:hypothetical protein